MDISHFIRRVCGKAKQRNSTDHQQHQSKLMPMPAELRSMIYRFALISTIEIDINNAFREPALLSTCRTIRQEAITIYYLENLFMIHCSDWDHTYVKKFALRLLRQVGPEATAKTRSITANLGSWTNKKNLLLMLKAFHGGEIAGLQNKDQGHTVAAIVGAFKITREMRAHPWMAVERVLGVYLEEVAKPKVGWVWQ